MKNLMAVVTRDRWYYQSERQWRQLPDMIGKLMVETRHSRHNTISAAPIGALKDITVCSKPFQLLKVSPNWQTVNL